MAVQTKRPGRTFRAMGTDCHVVVTGPNAQHLTDIAVSRVAQLESRWSRFDSRSEVSRVNQAAGSAVAVSACTVELVETARTAWRLTGGLFDPTMHGQINRLGYDRSFDTLPESSASHAGVIDPSVGCRDIETSYQDLTVALPAGSAFDPGGIGKGFAADLVSRDLMECGADGVLVSLGGDMRVRGVAPDGPAWVVQIIEPELSPEPLTHLALNDAGLATSTTLRKRWRTRDGVRHHILNPATGLPHDGDVVLASAIAGEAWWAEAAAKAALIRPEDSYPSTPNAATYRVFAGGRNERWGDFESYER
jgi:thiamine biosynthesis lipoprotein